MTGHGDVKLTNGFIRDSVAECVVRRVGSCPQFPLSLHPGSNSFSSSMLFHHPVSALESVDHGLKPRAKIKLSSFNLSQIFCPSDEEVTRATYKLLNSVDCENSHHKQINSKYVR